MAKKKQREELIAPNYKAMRAKITSGGLYVIKLHYAADAHKNPQNSVGKQWLHEALSDYPHGIEDSDWLKEMEIQYTAGKGGKVFPYWAYWLKHANIICRDAVDVTGAKLYGSYDHGYSSPACYHVHAVWPDGERITLWEFYAERVSVPEIARIIKGNRVKVADGREFEGNPYAGQERIKICDPEIARLTQVQSKGANKSIADLFRREGVTFTKGSSGDDLTVISWLEGNLWLDPMEPEYQIHESCVKTIWEFGRLQYKSLTSVVAKSKNTPEGIVDKDNHAFDSIKYWLKRFPVGVKKKKKTEKVADFQFWLNLNKSKVRTSYVRNF